MFTDWWSVGCGSPLAEGLCGKLFPLPDPQTLPCDAPHLSLSLFGYLNNQDPTLEMEAPVKA